MHDLLRNATGKGILHSLLIGMAFTLALMLGRGLGAIEFLELRAYDLMVKAGSALHQSAPPAALVIADESDIARFGWPVSDQVLAELLTRLLAAKPRAIGVDLYRDQPRPPGEERLAAAFAANSNIIAVFRLGEGKERGVAPPPVLASTDRVALADLPVDTDGTVRRGVLYLGDETGTFPSFALRLATEYLSHEGIHPMASEADPNWLRLGATTLPPLSGNIGGYHAFDSAGYQFLLDFLDARERFPAYSFGDVFDGKLRMSDLNERLIVVGVNALSVKDSFFTPEDRFSARGSSTAGSLLQGQAATQLIRLARGETKVAQSPAESMEYLLIAVYGLAGSLAGVFARRYLLLGLLVVAGTLVTVGISFAAAASGWWISVVPDVLALLISSTLVSAYVTSREKQERRIYRQSLMAYLSPPVVEQILAGHLKPELGGERRDVTVMFSDIRGYTTLSESMTPEQVIGFLNQYFEKIVDDIHSHGGTVVSFMGDGIMAVFGAPANLANSQQAAFDASKAMLRSVDELNKVRISRKEELIRIGIGLNYGSAVVGHVGAENRHEYTAIGDATNVASRLEGLTKDAGYPVVCSASVVQALVDKHQLVALGEQPIKGHAPVDTFGYAPEGA